VYQINNHNISKTSRHGDLRSQPETNYYISKIGRVLGRATNVLDEEQSYPICNPKI